MIKLVVGLGNPTKEYESTRHNIGFMVIDRLAEELNLSFSSGFNGLYASCNVLGNKVFFLKPMSYMNLSGGPVSEMACYYKIEPDEIFVIHDEMNIPYGQIKIRHNGTAGGHNGLSSIIERTGSKEFPRLKMGIDKKTGGGAVGHVLGKFNEEERKSLDEFIELGKNAVMSVLEVGVAKAMTVFNQSKKSEKTEKVEENTGASAEKTEK